MKYILQVCIAAALFCACKSTTSSPPATDSTAAEATEFISNVIGLYSGDFGGSNIYITINHAKNRHIGGYNVHKGLRRNLSGTYDLSEKGFTATLNEPGDHPFDGKFVLDFSFDGKTATGTWTPNNKSAAKAKTFTLKQVSDDKAEYKDYIVNADHRDLVFSKDGSVTLNYYEKVTDSTFAQQMTTLKGTWEKQGEDLVVTWGKTNVAIPTKYRLQWAGEGEERYFEGFLDTDSTQYWVGP